MFSSYQICNAPPFFTQKRFLKTQDNLMDIWWWFWCVIKLFENIVTRFHPLPCLRDMGSRYWRDGRAQRSGWKLSDLIVQVWTQHSSLTSCKPKAGLLASLSLHFLFYSVRCSSTLLQVLHESNEWLRVKLRMLHTGNAQNQNWTDVTIKVLRNHVFGSCSWQPCGRGLTLDSDRVGVHALSLYILLSKFL